MRGPAGKSGGRRLADLEEDVSDAQLGPGPVVIKFGGGNRCAKHSEIFAPYSKKNLTTFLALQNAIGFLNGP